MKAVFDTRFFVASLESKDSEFRKWAKQTLEALQRRGNSGIIPSIVVHEFYKLQLEKNGVEIADMRVDSLLKLYLQVSNLDTSIAVEAAKLRCRYSELPTADAIIAATAVVTSSECVLTDDRHIRQVRETKTRWI